MKKVGSLLFLGVMFFLLFSCTNNTELYYASDIKYAWDKDQKGWLVVGYNEEESGKDLVIPEKIINSRDKVIAIADKAFMDSNIRSIKLADSIKYIGKEAFRNSSISEEVDLSNVTEIDDFAFANTNIEKFNIPSTLIKLGKGSLIPSDATKNNIIVDLDMYEKSYGTKMPKSTQRHNYLFNNDWTDKTMYNSLDQIIFLDSIKSIESFALSGNILNQIDIDKNLDDKITTFEIKEVNIQPITISDNIKDKITFKIDNSAYPWAKINSEGQVEIDNDLYDQNAQGLESLKLKVNASTIYNNIPITKEIEFDINRPEFKGMAMPDLSVIYDVKTFKYPEKYFDIQAIPTYSIVKGLENATINSEDNTIATVELDKIRRRIKVTPLKEEATLNPTTVTLRSNTAILGTSLLSLDKYIVKQDRSNLDEDLKNMSANTELKYIILNKLKLEYPKLMEEVKKLEGINALNYIKNYLFNLNEIDVKEMQDLSSLFFAYAYLDGKDALIKFEATTEAEYEEYNKLTDMIRYLERVTLGIESWNMENATSTSAMFAAQTGDGTGPIKGLENFKFPKLKDMSYMFAYRDNIADITKWDVSTVENMEGLFTRTSNFNQDITGWDVSNVVNMSKLLQGNSSFTHDLSKWNFSNVKDISYMLASSAYNHSIVSWDTSNVEDMSGLFSNTSYNIALAGLNTSKVKNMSRVFQNNSEFNQNINDWDVSKVEDMSLLFSTATKFNQPLNNWKTDSLKNMNAMFFRANIFNQDLSNFNTSNVTNLRRTFAYAHLFNQPLNSWDTSNVTDMERTFMYAYAFNQPLNNWNTSKVTTMSNMFNGDFAFNSDITTWDVSNVTDMEALFNDLALFNQDISKWNTSKVKTMQFMFRNSKVFNQDLSNWDVSSVENFQQTFWRAYTFNQDLSRWNTKSATTMLAMFEGATALNSDFKNWNVAKVENMAGMFHDVKSFNSDISGWDVSKVTNMSNMFRNTVEFEQDLSSWNDKLPANVAHTNTFLGAEKMLAKPEYIPEKLKN